MEFPTLGLFITRPNVIDMDIVEPTAEPETRREREVLDQVFRRISEDHSDRVCLIHGTEELTYRQVIDQVSRLANGLTALGVRKGEKVALLFSNRAAYIVSYLACASIGAVLVPVNPKFRPREILYVLNNCDAVALITLEEFIEPLAAMPSVPAQLRSVILHGLDSRLGRGARLPHPSAGWHWHDFERLIRESSPREPSVIVEPQDPLGIFYTSGTTGTPKGVLLTNRMVLAGLDGWIDGLSLNERSRSLLVAPFFHMVFNAFVLSVLCAGGSSVIVDSFQLKVLLKEAERTRPTLTFAVPSVFIAMSNYPQIRDYDLSSLGAILYGAAPMPVEMIHRLDELFGGNQMNVCGQTETSGAISRLLPEFALSKAGSIGTPLKGLQVSIFDENDQALPPNTIGEICLRGPNVFKEYYKLPEVTAKKLRGGWHHTGDLGYLDEEGFIYISDRKDDLIITSGERVFPGEVEEVLFTHPDVLDAAVVGVPDRARGEAVAAFIVPRAGREICSASVRQLLRERMTPYKVPRYVQVVESIPRNASGKTLRGELRQLHVASTGAIGTE
jgi:long-chain acyl-CoA synthetase